MELENFYDLTVAINFLETQKKTDYRENASLITHSDRLPARPPLCPLVDMMERTMLPDEDNKIIIIQGLLCARSPPAGTGSGNSRN